MKLAATIVFLTLGAVCHADDQPSDPPSLYDKIIKVVSQQDRLLVDLNGKEYSFGLFDDTGAFLKEVAWDPDAAGLFRKSAADFHRVLVARISEVGLFGGCAGALYLAYLQPKGSGWIPVWGATAIVLEFVGLVVDGTASAVSLAGTENFFNGVNQYNKDVVGRNQ